MAINTDSIPKKIHYCWFGGKPLPEKARKCIDSWRQFCPDYEIIEWNEKNYDLSSCDYVKEAYEAQKWAFVSDYARFDILYRYGGIYFDTDVELIRNINDVVTAGPFMGSEISTVALNGTVTVSVNPGLGIGAPAGIEFYKNVLDLYRSLHFACSDIQKTVVEHVTGLLVFNGYEYKDTLQKVSGITIYPSCYFSPMNNMTGELSITSETRSIHHYDATWMHWTGKVSIAISRYFSGKGKAGKKFGAVIALPFRFMNRVQTDGFINTVKYLHTHL